MQSLPSKLRDFETQRQSAVGMSCRQHWTGHDKPKRQPQPEQARLQESGAWQSCRHGALQRLTLHTLNTEWVC